MKNHRLRRRRHTLLHLLTTLLVIVVLAMLQGCGGGGSGSGGSSFGGGDGSGLASTPGTGSTPTTTTNPGTNPGTTTAGTGTFKAIIQVPARQKSDEKVIPYRAAWARVTIDAETGGTQTDEEAITPGGTAALEITSVIVGIHNATIEIRTEAAGGGTLLASRKHGFYMISGDIVNAGTLHMGVAIGADGHCDPAKIDIPEGTTLFFENRDTAAAHTITAGRIAGHNEVTTGSIAAVTAGSETAGDTYNAASIAFAPGSAGSYVYKTGEGGDDTDTYRILVYAVPTITSVTNAAGYDFDKDTGDTDVNFVINGTNFGDDRTLVNGTVSFQSDAGGSTAINVANFTTWTNTQVTGTVNLPGIPSGNHYVVTITVRGTAAIAPNNFYKGASCPVPTVTSIKDNNGAGDNYSADNNQETVTFVIAGTNLGSDQTMVGGTVTFFDVKPPGATTDYAATVTAWADTQITGTIVLPKSTNGTGALDAGGGKYKIKINARGSTSTQNIYYYKGTGTYTVTVD
ncbi:MAG: hypothetical protein AB2L14_04215 [Candidatus Xenobiia bacterium LiM19]